MSETTLLGLPLMASGQAQKHVTHNEALLRLDALVQLSAASRSQAAPPTGPAEGARYLVAAAASGVWAGCDGEIATWQNGAWVFATPQRGWRLWVEDEDALLAFTGTAWKEVGAPPDMQNLSGVGINATADATNKLAVSSPAALFNNAGSDIRLKLNKSAAADTASALFQTGYQGRAELGLTGDDNFRIKVSSDGAAWHEAIVIDKATGAVSLPATPSSGVSDGNRGDISVSGSGGTWTVNAASITASKLAGEVTALLADATASSKGLMPALDKIKADGAATRTALAAVAPAAGTMLLREAGREGLFAWDAGVAAATHQADTQQAIHVAPNAAAAGAWVRVEAAQGVLRPEWFGAKADGVTDDSAALQAALDFCPLTGVVQLAAGKTYAYQHLKMPTPAGGSSGNNGPMLCATGGRATLKRLAVSGSTDYGIATSRWLSADANKSYGGSPWHFRNIIFDGNGAVALNVVIKSWGTEFHDCNFQGATHTDLLFTRQNQDGSDGCSSFLADFKAMRCRFTGNGTYGFRTEGIASQPVYAPTDGVVYNCIVSGAYSYGFYIMNMGGWSVVDNHFFYQTTRSAVFRNIQKHAIIAHNTFDQPGLVEFGEFNWPRAAVIGPGNRFYKNALVTFTPGTDGTVEKAILWGNFFTEDNAGVQSFIQHGYNHASKQIISRDNFFTTTAPHQYAAGVTLGSYLVDGGVDGNGLLPAATGAAATLENDALVSGLDLLNAAPNGSFQMGNYGWDEFNDWTIVNEPANAYAGNYVAKNTNTGGVLKNMPMRSYAAVTPGDRVYAGAMIKTDAGMAMTGLQVGLNWYDKDKVYLSSYSSTNLTGDHPAYERLEVTATAPANAVYFRARVFVTKTAGNVYVGAFEVYRKRDAARLLKDASVTAAQLGGDITAAGKALLDDADAAAQRTTLGLGSAATQASAAFDAAGAATAAVAAHTAAGDPHPQYLTQSEGDGRYALLGTGGSGDVTGPAGTTDRALPRFTGTTGKILQGSAVLLNDDGSLRLPTAAAAAAATDTVHLHAFDVAGRAMLAGRAASGAPAVAQPLIARNKIALWSPPGNATTLPGVFGIAAPTVLGTTTVRSVAATNLLTRMRRLGYVSAATAGSMAGHYGTVSQFSIGDGAGLGGFLMIVRFGVSDAATVPAARMFVGLRSATASPTNVEPNTLTNAIGAAQLSTSGNLQIVYGGSVAQTAIDLGASFPANTLSADAYELALYAPCSSQVVGYRVERLNTGAVSSGTLTGAVGTAIPAASTFLNAAMWRGNNATALAVGIDITSFYIETDA